MREILAAVRASAPAHQANGERDEDFITQASQTITDPVGDTPGNPDITAASLTLGDDGYLTGVMAVNSFSTPTDQNWTVGFSAALWWIDVNGDLSSDYYLILANTGTQVYSGLYQRFTNTGICGGGWAYGGSGKIYGAYVNSGCLGNIASARWYSQMYFDNVSNGQESSDFAPNTTWAGPVVNDGFPGKLPGGNYLQKRVLGVGGVPASGVSAVALNVTVTSTFGDGYLTVYPCGTLPNSSNLNYVRGQTIPNMVIAPVSAGGDVCFYTSSATHLIVDVSGWFNATPSGFQSLVPTRVLDTRSGIGGPAGKIGAGGRTLQISGANGIPPGTGAVSLNVTATGPTGPGYMTVYPCGAIPNASNLNFATNQTVPNAVIAPLSASGTICLQTTATTDVIIDVNGWFPVAPNGFQPLTPTRVFDTRSGQGGVPAVKLSPGAPLAIKVTEVNGVPTTVAAVSLNVTVTAPGGAGYVTVYPCGGIPNASNLNFLTDQNVPNAVIAPVSAGGFVCFVSSVATHLIADVNGWFPTTGSPATFQGQTPARIVDTRAGLV